MRIWDIDPGYLNNGSLLAEHRELHALYNVLTKDLPGFATQRELHRWRDHIPALIQRHRRLVAEMKLRGITHRSPLPSALSDLDWPNDFVDNPDRQFALLQQRYMKKPAGRIPFPKDLHILWAQHKYSVMARDPKLSKSLGRQVSDGSLTFPELCEDLVEILRERPTEGRLTNAVEHMWGYVNKSAIPPSNSIFRQTYRLLQETRKRAQEGEITYLIHSTALGELGQFFEDDPASNS